ncbi:MAG: DUF167 domain-containing protein [Deltaproteobacteria bacterium]|nr:DUF167 domain-containing protein [Deltaproteobacteria bacterium]
MVQKQHPWLTTYENSFILDVFAQPQAKHSEIRGVYGDRLRIAVAAKAHKGAANKELIRFLSDLLRIKQSDVEILKGDLGRKKRVRIDSPWSSNICNILTKST